MANHNFKTFTIQTNDATDEENAIVEALLVQVLKELATTTHIEVLGEVFVDGGTY